ncbi:MAG: AMP-binding protein [Desulfosarcina sp.]|nr:AMP-binding protein [Desulfosarcina sp.]
MLKPAKDYQTRCDTFRWEVPDPYNIGVDICDKRAHQPGRLALIYEDNAGRTRRYTFLDLKRRSNRLANGLKAMGIDAFTPVRTRADEPALIIYTSGTTGPPKGALHAHRVLLGHLPGVEFPHNFFPCEGDRFRTPADWAWIGGLIDVLFPSWHHGIAVVAHRARKFDPEEAFHLLAKNCSRNAFMPPTALKLMRQVKDHAPGA